ncbi:hypothetical protein L1887_53642 [Cichorium endivia]|nr:hypothetical protein L1887_53642 [Cichorium endivia]
MVSSRAFWPSEFDRESSSCLRTSVRCRSCPLAFVSLDRAAAICAVEARNFACRDHAACAHAGPPNSTAAVLSA